MVKPEQYNDARNLLILAGSKSAQKSHPKHKGANNQNIDLHALSLLREARDEFNDLTEPGRTVGRRHVVRAAELMGITKW